MKVSKLTLIIISIVAMIFSSCSQRILDFTIVSSKNIDLSNAASFERGKQRVEGVDKVYIILIIPTGTPNLKEALDRAIETTPGCVALVDGVITYKYLWFLLFGETSYIIEGTPLIDKSLAINSTNYPEYKKIEINKNGGVKSVEILSAPEYLAVKNKIVKDSKVKRFKNSAELN